MNLSYLTDKMKTAFAFASASTLAAGVAINPTVVSSMLADQEDDWVEHAVIGLVGGAPEKQKAKSMMVASCSELVGSILKASEGEKDRVSEYFGDVCNASKKPGQCKEFQDSLLDFMTDDAERNRNELDESKFCTGFFAKVEDMAFNEAERRKKVAATKKAEEAKKAKAHQLFLKKAAAEKSEKMKKEKIAFEKKMKAEAAKKAAAAKTKAEAEKKAKAEAAKKAAKVAADKKVKAEKDAVTKKAELEKEAKEKLAKANKDATMKKQELEKEAETKKQQLEAELAAKKKALEAESGLAKAKQVFLAAEKRIEFQTSKFGKMIEAYSEKVKKAEKKPVVAEKKAAAPKVAEKKAIKPVKKTAAVKAQKKLF